MPAQSVGSLLNDWFTCVCIAVLAVLILTYKEMLLMTVKFLLVAAPASVIFVVSAFILNVFVNKTYEEMDCLSWFTCISVAAIAGIVLSMRDVIFRMVSVLLVAGPITMLTIVCAIIANMHVKNKYKHFYNEAEKEGLSIIDAVIPEEDEVDIPVLADLPDFLCESFKAPTIRDVMKEAKVAAFSYERTVRVKKLIMRPEAKKSRITEADAISIRAYTGELYYTWNRALIEKDGRGFRNASWQATSGLRKLRTLRDPNPPILWRGFRGCITDLRAGRKLVFKNFTSCSTDKGVASFFGMEEQITLFCFESHMRAVPIAWLSVHPKEREWLFPPYCRFEVIRTKREDERVVIATCKEIERASLTRGRQAPTSIRADYPPPQPHEYARRLPCEKRKLEQLYKDDLQDECKRRRLPDKITKAQMAEALEQTLLNERWLCDVCQALAQPGSKCCGGNSFDRGGKRVYEASIDKQDAPCVVS